MPKLGSSVPSLIRFLCLATFALLATALPAQFGSKIKHPVAATARFEPAEAKRGETVQLIITATVDEGYHLYAMKQPSGVAGPIPIEAHLAKDWDAVLEPVGDWQEPQSRIKFDKGFEIDVAVLEGSPVEFRRSFRLRGDATVGTVTAAGHLFVQACTAESCLPPVKRPFEVKLVVAAGAAVVVEEPAAATPAPTSEVAPPTSTATSPTAPSGAAKAPASGALDSSIEGDLKGKSLSSFILASFFFGLLALLTPCVFPMIPITVSFFTKTKAATRGQAIMNAGVYAGSIILGFTLIGFVVSMLLRVFGGGVEQSGFANQLAANPWVNLAFALLYLIFALSLFEILHLSLPSWVTGGVNQAAQGRTDFFGIAMKALVFVLISFTCTAPLIGVLIVQTLSGEWTRPLVGMMSFSAGFALPFFVLALVPQYLSALPKAGGWLFATKMVMGMLVLAAALKFLSNADLVLYQEDMIITREVFLAIWAGIAAATALYLFGMIRVPDDDSGVVSIPRFLLGSVFFTVAIYLAGGLFGTRLKGWIEAYLPPDLSPAVVSTAAAGATGQKGDGWLKSREEAFALAREKGVPVFIDFTGFSCTNCRLMEKNMFPRPEVAALLDRYVRVKLYTDDRTPVPGTDQTVGEINLEYQAATFNTVTLPFYAIVTPDGELIAQAEYTTDADKFVRFLESGLKSR
jgi:thiol:disulfide interchange protein DsbD